mmetsp:Transcript_9722/g.29565  ORF Transcript_9722/g.29565 Transcript_9722/m.29565 type:complete len:421 (-) Transcript_9722:339-1601(-)|eukprot:CAMPEP_0198730116 /NCGR_PEP_ID=MMETSP1475-20131203/22887_1 /TAXON_ID= ORGANISM="Unidentified sp., Strain CCMP1999" /NCGR_SAMPLE_ID=MMETSP1475 /ASSEMBLY_ACC=CAM_ASM_001111 /LENGTH=420 /DNA_ID=CAMNT_0044492883 /DNA_START=84 /DNA_END=1346 /DNA_ORIENTATION=+
MAAAQKWLVAVSASLYFTVLSSLVYFTPATLVESMHKQMGVSVAEATIPLNVNKLTLIVLLPFAGYLVQKVQLRRAFLLGASAVGILSVLYPFSANVTQMIYIQILLAVCATFCGLPCLFQIVVTWFGDEVGIASAVVVMGWSIAGVATPALLAKHADTYGWRTALMCTSLSYILLALPIAVFVLKPRKNTEQNVADQSSTEQQTPLGEILSRKAFWILATVYFTLSYAIGVVFDHYLVYLTEERHFSMTVAGQLVSLLNLVALCTKLVSGIVGDRAGHLRILCLGSLSAFMSSLLLFHKASSKSLFVLFSAVFGFGYAAVFCSMCAAVPLIFGARHTLTVQSMMLCSMYIASAFGSTLAGLCQSNSGDYTPVLHTMIVALALNAISSMYLVVCEGGGCRISKDDGEREHLLRRKLIEDP